MDALVFMVISLVLTILEINKPDEVAASMDDMQDLKVSSDRVSKLNENFNHDDDAFSEIIHALGFPKGV